MVLHFSQDAINIQVDSASPDRWRQEPYFSKLTEWSLHGIRVTANNRGYATLIVAGSDKFLLLGRTAVPEPTLFGTALVPMTADTFHYWKARSRENAMITAIVLYDLLASIGFEECRAHFTSIAPDFLSAPGFVRKQFICKKEGGVAGGVYMWESQAAAGAFYTGPWREGIRVRYGKDPKIQYFETVALTDKATGYAGALK